MALAQAYPAKPLRMIIPFPPGGPTDLMGRMAADRLSRSLGVQVIPDNRGGAGGNIGFELCAKSPPDGYTVCMMTVAQSISPGIYRKLGYDLAKDFSFVTLMATLPSMLTTHPSFPAKNVKEVIAIAKSRPGPDHLLLHRQRHEPPHADGDVQVTWRAWTWCTCRTRARRSR